MAHDPSSTAYLVASAIAAVATIIVAWITRGRGNKAAGSDAPFKPQESGEHAHTRDVVRDGFDGLHRRLDVFEAARGAQRQSDQLGLSAARLTEREDEK